MPINIEEVEWFLPQHYLVYLHKIFEVSYTSGKMGDSMWGNREVGWHSGVTLSMGVPGTGRHLWLEET